MADRYFVETAIDGVQARLIGPEAHHLAHVMRAKTGDLVTLFDGSGQEFSGRVERVGRAEIELSVLGSEPVDRELPLAITLGVALPKGDRQRWLVEKAVELGVARLAPLQTERGNDRESAAGLDKLRRAVIEASKQCGRNRLMTIDAPLPAAHFFAAKARDVIGLLADPGHASCHGVLNETREAPAQMQLAVGPEGGFTDAEIETAAGNGWTAVGLGKRILRVETAALMLAAAVASRWSGA